MGKQLIISLTRESGSGGHFIAAQLAKRFELPIYDHNLLDEVAREKGFNVQKLNKYDELPKKKFLSRSVRGFSNSPEENIAMMQFDFLRDKAESGESFVVVGRCSESVLQDYEGLISIFIIGDREAKIKRVENVRGFSRKAAEEAIARHDKTRRDYHNHYCDIKWGDARHYELCMNSSKLGLERTIDFIETYIKERTEK